MDGHTLLQVEGKPQESAAAGKSRLAPKSLTYRKHHLHIFRTEILWRGAGALMFNILIMVVLYLYARMDELNTWDRRVFNALTILLTSLMSLTLGSLLTVLGTMIRWPILARWNHTARDVSCHAASPCWKMKLDANGLIRLTLSSEWLISPRQLALSGIILSLGAQA
jgi:hypothetical protein